MELFSPDYVYKNIRHKNYGGIKMKKRLSLILAVILIMVCLTGCGAAAKDSAAYDSGTSNGFYGGAPEASEESFDMEAD